MKLLPLICLALVSAAPLAASEDVSEQALSSRFTNLDDCKLIADGDAEGEDWISYRCSGFGNIPIWLTYADSARSYLGFGLKENLSGPFALARDGTWPIEWRGLEQDGAFAPIAVIVRMFRPEVGAPTDGQGLLFVFRLKADGTSCIVASDLPSNDFAREEADHTSGDFDCLFEPDVPGTT